MHIDSREGAEDFATRGFELADWQQEAVERWWQGDEKGPRRGTLEIFTGGGKTLIALSCIERAASKFPDLKVAVVVPTEALARQWRNVIVERTHMAAEQIGVLGAGRKQSLSGRRALVCVLNTAAKVLPDIAESAQPLMLVVDECHRAGAPTFSKVLKTRAVATLGLSATPEREELDEEGEPLVFDEQLVGLALGSVVERFTLKEAREAGWLPDYVIHHHGISLSEEEARDYEAISRRVDDAADRLKELGIDTSRARMIAARSDEAGKLAQAWVGATSLRKDLLYRAKERERIAAQLIADAMHRREARILLFHERVGEAKELFERLTREHPQVSVVLEHSRLPARERVDALEAFRSGKSPVLVSVKSLVEGLDVPDADVGISVASSSSVRQRIQSLGRVLRRRFDSSSPKKHAEMHIIYVSGTVDELIYAKEDWSDLTGQGSNTYWIWEFETETPTSRVRPPREPLPTEEQEWERLDRKVPKSPVRWGGVIPTLEYSVDTRGNVTNAVGSVIANPQGVDRMVEAVRGKPGGRFRVTPVQRLVIVFGEGADGPTPYLAGRLEEPFSIRSFEGQSVKSVDREGLKPGSPYPGPASKEHGSFRLRQKRGGVIERRSGSNTVEFALLDGAEEARTRNAQLILESWKHVSEKGFEFHVNELWDAWYMEGGEPRFLARVPGGFAWPSEKRRTDALSG